MVSERKHLLNILEITTENAGRLPAGAAFKKRDSMWLTIEGASMHPFLSSNDKVEIAPLSVNSLERADVVIYRLHSKTFVHRVLKKPIKADCQRLLTKGDANLFWDGPFVESADCFILGKAAAVQKNGLSIDLTTKTWRAFSVIITPFSYLAGLMHDRAIRQERCWQSQSMLLVARIMRRLTVFTSWLVISAAMRHMHSSQNRGRKR